MKTYTFTQRQLVPRPIGEVFEFFSRPENLQRLTPDALGLRILTPMPISMEEGALIDYSLRIAGVPVRWTTRITLWEPPHRFTDIQLNGPYACWNHRHTFTESADGTLIADEIVYAMPFGLLGRVTRALFVGAQIEDIFRKRSYVIEKIFPKEQHS